MDNNNTNNTAGDEKTCEYCNASENERPIFTTDFKGRKLHVCARCLPGLIHG